MMNIIPYAPIRKSDIVRSGYTLPGFYNIFDDFFSNNLSKYQPALRTSFKVDVVENENEYLVEADMPGISKEEIDLTIEDNSLLITVSHEDKKTTEEKNFLHKERFISSMKRRINLDDVKFDEISAKLENGVLSIIVPKDDSANELRKIEIA